MSIEISYILGAKVIVVSEQGNSIQGKLDKALFKDKPILLKQMDTLDRRFGKLGQLAHEKI